MEIISKKHNCCRVCGHTELKPYLDLGEIPLANNLFDTQEEAINAPRLPLIVAWCKNCGLSQLTEVVDGSQLFSHYTYRSSVNQGYVEHCRQMAKELKEKYGLNADTRHLDIAGNDGTLLKQFQNELKHYVVNIDPAENLCEIAINNSINSICTFWGLEVAKQFYSKIDLITATNVFAHLDNVTEFLEACKIALKDDGVIVIENPYWPETMMGNQFDQVYFEHMSYWSVNPMLALCEKVGLHLVDVSSQKIHGGTHKLCAFAASAKGNTLLNFCGIDHNVIEFIVDQTPEKIGKYSPGTGIPIVGFEKIIEYQPDYVLILSWNFKEEIIAKLRPVIPNAKFIVPIPKWEVI